MMKYWNYDDFDIAMDKGYLNAMMLNACIPTYESKGGSVESPSGGSMSFFDFGKKLSGL